MPFLNTKHFQEIRNIQTLNSLDESLRCAIQYHGESRIYDGVPIQILEITLFKQEGWLAIPVSDSDFLTQTFQQSLYEALISHKFLNLYVLLLGSQSFVGYSGSSSLDSLYELRHEMSPYYSVLFTGVPEPNFVIVSIESEYYVVAGKASFIHQVFGNNLQAYFWEFQEFAVSEGSVRQKKHLSWLCHQLKHEYEKAKVGAEFYVTPLLTDIAAILNGTNELT